ncbi:Adenylate cyclase [Candidatus Terasakiella magnetica]|uniref:Adenylate cyclase n=1 Tax=Candidatus Terasakiella magnetica TaxID=1867952 RepID=A0A1C3RET8_9PROT|nr:CYTH domain-containing protein [Candidatus Terasakiella magnetica]SCA55806.1 Adenylate cyclase [Candidatus Terasakiella magnetica]
MSNQLEIERKFLVIGSGWKDGADCKKISQGYISKDESVVVRVRTKGPKSFLTIKADRGGISRLEFEYEIPNEDCEKMLAELCGDAIEKTRYTLEAAGNTWEIDEFHGVNDGLVMAEIELESPDQSFEKPDWAGPEVSHDNRFFNSYISEHPFSSWGVSFEALVKEFE